MPFVNGRFYINPTYGRALERARAAESDAGESESGEADSHWVTTNHEHVLIHERQQPGWQQQPNPIAVSVSVAQEPQIITNLQLGKNKVTGVGAQLRIAFLDARGKPLAGAVVSESNEQGGLQNRRGAKTASDGSIRDWILRGGPSETMPGTTADLKNYVNTHPITVTSTQRLTVTSGTLSYGVTWTRTLTNVSARGNLNTSRNKHGVNFSISWTTPVVRRLQ